MDRSAHMASSAHRVHEDPDLRPAVWGGVMFGLVLGAVFLISSGGMMLATIGVALASAVFFGLVLHRGLGRQRRAAVQALGPAGPTLSRDDVRDALTGPPAQEVAAREEQVRIVDLQIAQTRQAGRRTTVLFAILLFAEVALAITSSSWFWLAAALFLFLLVMRPVQLAKLQRRRTELVAATTPAS